MGNRIGSAFRVLVFGLALCGYAVPAALAIGRFEGKIITEWLDEDGHRYMKLHQSFSYFDSGGRRWSVPAGIKIDGASIPRVFWSIIGGPFEGPYRDAAVVHDHYCEKRTRTWEDVHKVFYDAMLTRGVGQAKAWLMYRAVLEFGPKWVAPKLDPSCLRVDGKIDFGKCTDNTATIPATESTKREVTRDSLLEFLKQVEGQANPTDIELLRTEAERLTY